MPWPEWSPRTSPGPASTEEAAGLLRAAAAAGLAVVPRGAGTGFGWGSPPSRCDLVVDLGSMDKVIEHGAGDLVVQVQAGLTIGALAAALACGRARSSRSTCRPRRRWAGWWPPGRPGRGGCATGRRATCSSA